MQNKTPILILLFFFVFSPTVFATSLSEPVTFDSLVENSKWIVLARVNKIRSYYVPQNEEAAAWLGRNEIIFSDISIEILKSYKGDLQQTLTLNMPGGCIVDQCFNISLFPTNEFRAGKRVVLFLQEVGPGHIKEVVFGEFGSLRINDDDTFKEWKMDLKQFEKQINEKIKNKKKGK